MFTQFFKPNVHENHYRNMTVEVECNCQAKIISFVHMRESFKGFLIEITIDMIFPLRNKYLA
jgi:hypothetical protein